MIETLPRLFLNIVASYPKDDFMMFKKGGSYRSLSTAEFTARGRPFSLGFLILDRKRSRSWISSPRRAAERSCAAS